MAVVDFILNLIGLLFWMNWRSGTFDPLASSTPVTLLGTLRRTEPGHSHRWFFLVALLGLLFFRGVLYWQIGSAVNWTPRLELGAIAISLRSDYLSRALLFSLFSFVIALMVFYVWLLLLSLINRRGGDTEPWQKLVRLHLGSIARWPWPLKSLLPLAIAGLLWLGLNPLLAYWQIIPPARSPVHRLEQAAAIGVGAYLTWKYLVGAILVLYLLSSYVYLGNHSFWSFIALTGRNLVSPLHWLPLRIGKIDLSPIVGIALVLFAAALAERWLTQFYARLQF
jgi:uncharacterized protein YggT (Ycf19 family)